MSLVRWVSSSTTNTREDLVSASAWCTEVDEEEVEVEEGVPVVEEVEGGFVRSGVGGGVGDEGDL